ncbi:hypothetical protein SDJN02_03314 [Cucurbita argyrosperma subsp. argyrosperma]|nr:hypothetical protein SDJN02_03314 [Cucurbita argyrosperma subsp. argyrosperma]
MISYAFIHIGKEGENSVDSNLKLRSGRAFSIQKSICNASKFPILFTVVGLAEGRYVGVGEAGLRLILIWSLKFQNDRF